MKKNGDSQGKPSKEEDVHRESRKEMIEGILSLSKLNARDIMIPRVDTVAINEEISLKELLDVVSEASHSRIPVFQDTIDNISGILYVKDLINFLSNKKRKFDIKKFLHKPLFVPESMTLDELLLVFQKKRQHLAIVVDEYGGFAGIVTMEDIFEEIFGDIDDEFDEKTESEIIKINKTTYEVEARTSIEDLNNELGLDLPTNDFDTMGGFVLDLFGKIPSKGEIIDHRNLTIKIKDVKGTRINRVIIVINKKP